MNRPQDVILHHKLKLYAKVSLKSHFCIAHVVAAVIVTNYQQPEYDVKSLKMLDGYSDMMQLKSAELL